MRQVQGAAKRSRAERALRRGLEARRVYAIRMLEEVDKADGTRQAARKVGAWATQGTSCSAPCRMGPVGGHMVDEDVVEESADRQLLVVELQKAWKRKHIKGLRKGKGKLLGKIEELVEDPKRRASSVRTCSPWSSSLGRDRPARVSERLIAGPRRGSVR